MITIDPVITTYMVGFSAWELRRRMERGAARVLVSTSQVAPTLRPSPKAHGRLRADNDDPPPAERRDPAADARGGATERRPGAAACRARPGLARRHLRVPVRS